MAVVISSREAYGKHTFNTHLGLLAFFPSRTDLPIRLGCSVLFVVLGNGYRAVDDFEDIGAQEIPLPEDADTGAIAVQQLAVLD